MVMITVSHSNIKIIAIYYVTNLLTQLNLTVTPSYRYYPYFLLWIRRP